MIRQFLTCCFFKALALKNYFPTTMTNREELNSLLKRLHPLSTDKGLIRLGPKGDGGYLVPNDLEGIYACFSPGVSSVSGFEKDCADLGMKVFLADNSIDRPTIDHKLFHFTKKFVGVTSNDNFFTLDDWVTAALPENQLDLLLQIDIESYEYEVFLSTSEKLMRQFRIIVAEFHLLDQLWSSPFYSIASRAFDKILQTHTCVHLHPNNCFESFKKDGLDIPRIMEFTFLRHDRIKNSSFQRSFPHPLDYNNTDNPFLPLSTCWYR